MPIGFRAVTKIMSMVPQATIAGLFLSAEGQVAAKEAMAKSDPTKKVVVTPCDLALATAEVCARALYPLLTGRESQPFR